MKGLLLSIVAAAGLTAATANADPVLLAPNQTTWNTEVTVGYNATAAIGNFQSPGTQSNAIAYTVYVRDDGNYFYVDLQTDPTAGTPVADFANLYFDTNEAQDGGASGSDIGIETSPTGSDYFVPSISTTTTFDASAYVTVNDVNSGGGLYTDEIAISNSFFTSSPGAGVPDATGNVIVRLSQSFGYSVAGGDATTISDPAYRLGFASVATPLPKSAWSGFALLGGIFCVGGVKRVRARTA